MQDLTTKPRPELVCVLFSGPPVKPRIWGFWSKLRFYLFG